MEPKRVHCEAELGRPSRVACNDWLNHMVCMVPNHENLQTLQIAIRAMCSNVDSATASR